MGGSWAGKVGTYLDAAGDSRVAESISFPLGATGCIHVHGIVHDGGGVSVSNALDEGAKTGRFEQLSLKVAAAVCGSVQLDRGEKCQTPGAQAALPPSMTIHYRQASISSRTRLRCRPGLLERLLLLAGDAPGSGQC